MNPKDILQKLEAAKVQAATDLSGQVDPRMAPGWEVAKQRAAEETAAMSAAYNTYVDQATAAIFVTGPESKRFAELAEEVGGTITTTVMGFYRELANEVYASMGGTGQFTPNQMAWVLSKLHTFAVNCGVRGYRVPHLDTALNITHSDPETTARAIKAAILGAEGDLFTAIWTRGDIRKQAYDQKRTDAVVPVVVLDAIPQEIENLTKHFGFTKFIEVEATETDETALKNEVVKAFTALKNAVKNHK